MNRFAWLVLLACAVTLFAAAPAAEAQPYVLRDTTGLPPTSPGKALLVVSRERMLEQGLKPEFVYMDEQPYGMLPPRSVVAGEITPGWHRLWLGRGAGAELWIEVVEGERYLVRLREALIEAEWTADLIRESRTDYLAFAKQKGMKVAITTPEGFGSMERHRTQLMTKMSATPDSTGRAKAQALSQLPIVITGAWGLDVEEKNEVSSKYDQHPGTLTVDANTLRYTQADTTVLEIPRSKITLLRYGGIKRNHVNPWLKVYYMAPDGYERGMSFVDPVKGQGTLSYNRLFAELEKSSTGK